MAPPTLLHIDTAGALLHVAIATLSAKADAALEAGNVPAYHEIVDKMIEVQDRYIDAHGSLPPKAQAQTNQRTP